MANRIGNHGNSDRPYFLGLQNHHGRWLKFSSVNKLCPTLFCTPGFPVNHQLPEFTQTHDHQVGDAIQPSQTLLSPSPPLIFPSIRILSNESVLCIRWPKYWSLSFSINPFNECSGLISFRMDWFDTLAVQGTLKSLLQHHSSKASILWCSASFMVQFSHPYLTIGKTIASTRWASLVAPMVKNPPAMWETWVRPLSCKDPLEEDMATHSSILAWKGAQWATVHGVTKSQTWLSN